MATQLTQHFSLDEFLTSSVALSNGVINIPRLCDSYVYINIRYVAYMLEIIRHQFGHPIRITSGYRRPELNKLVGGSPTSNHMKGLAVDIDCGKELNKKLYDVIDNLKDILFVNELINEQNYSWIHVSFKKI